MFLQMLKILSDLVTIKPSKETWREDRSRIILATHVPKLKTYVHACSLKFTG
ncbi:hypothetical protein SAMN02745166_00584 [Prosthecobacter debontii]|uniref:Uncharacterized protein n=1 Tax=Prosthecobacter debontii TaxID=48467 RepID=A0A1T4WTC0_9BACT|nr:hypothetical protein SAMN02745166_00584 [Prosthecobacter debontii]